MINTRIASLAAGLMVLATLVVLGSFSHVGRVEAGPDPCPPPDAATFFFDCFDLGPGDTNGTDDGDTASVVDSNNDGEWEQDESNDGCIIADEEMTLINHASVRQCTSVTSPVVTVSGYSAVTVRFEWGGRSLEASTTFGVRLSEDGGAFTDVATLPLAVGTDTCGTSAPTNCAVTTFNTTAAFDDCGEHRLQLQFTGPAAGGLTIPNIAVVDDVRFIGASQEGCEVDPTQPDISVTKVCSGTGFDATFGITIGTQTESVPCGSTTTLLDAPPGIYQISETISGPDAGAFTTTIVCSTDNAIVPGTTTSVTIPETGGEDVSCVIINFFGVDPDAVDDLICLCLNLDLEIDNTNTNAIGIDNDNTNTNANDNNNENDNENKNDNENNNTNTNTQDQDNKQDQDNDNDQTNNIDASPKVNIQR